MMDIIYIRKLLDAFYEGATTLKQEKELYWYFIQPDIPEELSGEKEFILGLLEVRGENEINAKKLDIKLRTLIDSFSENEHVKYNGNFNFWKWVGGIAASLVIITSIGLYMDSNYHVSKEMLFVDTYSSPEEAYRETQKILYLMSSKMNQGLNRLDKIETNLEKTNKFINEKFDVK